MDNAIMTASISLILLYLMWPSCSLGDNTFLVYNEGSKQCLKADDSAVTMAQCNENLIFQKWKWISSEHLINVGASQCLAVSSTSESSEVTLKACSINSDLHKWECKNETWFGVLKSDLHMTYTDSKIVLSSKTGDESQWKIYSTMEDLCVKPYEEIYTLQGNSNGQPCKFPFMYNNKAYVDCIKSARIKDAVWCSTTSDWTKNQLYGYCPSKSTVDSFWKEDSVTGIYYQTNTNAALTWYQAKRSCQQQDAELLSITELHEQSFISGSIGSHTTTLWIGLNKLDINSGWRWDGGDPFRYLNWLPGNPSDDSDVNCGAMNLKMNTKWESKECKQKLGYICKKGKKKSADTPSSDNSGSISCPPSWTLYNGQCYYLVKDTMKWEDAKLSCRKEEGDLVSVHNIEEASAIYSLFEFGGAEYVWLGLNDLKTQHWFEWSDGSSVTYTTWQRGEPSHQTNNQEDCVALSTKDGQWADQKCEKKFPYICKRKPLPKGEEQADPTDPGCDQGWKRHGFFCYLIGDTLSSYAEATNTCSHNGAYLLTVEDRFEQAYLISLIGLRSDKYFWIGLSDILERNTFQWANKQTVSYTHWNTDMPGERQGCVAMRTGNKAGLWDVVKCEEKAKFMCKKFAHGVTPPPPPATTAEPTCPTDWTSIDHACFKFYPSDKYVKRTWSEARDFCRTIGGDLLSITSPEEQSSVRSFMRTYTNRYIWSGLIKRGQDTDFTWSDGSPVTYREHIFWQYRIGPGEDNCVEMDSYDWESSQCETTKEWICKIKKGTTLNDEPKPFNYEFTSDGWLIYNESQYYISEDELSMEEALAFCKKNSSHLVTINGESERKFLWKYISSKQTIGDYYIGMRLGQDKEMKWMDGSPIDFVAWKLNQPDFANNDEFCVKMQPPSGLWNDVNCGVPYQFICERTNSSINSTFAPTLPGPEGGCPEHWHSFGQKCYGIFATEDDAVHWDNAKFQCQSFGGDLVSIRDDLVQTFLLYKLKDAPVDVWIGLHDKNKENKFVWTDQSGVYYTNWANGRPSHWRRWHTSDCVVLRHGNTFEAGTWIEQDCSLDRGYICQTYKDPSQPVKDNDPPDYNNYITYGDASYKFDRTKRTWDEARQECHLSGMKEKSQLASILDEYTTSFLKLHLMTLKEPFWIGLYSGNETEHTYKWVDNWRVRYTKWAPEEPRGDTSCVYVDIDGKWKTASCDERYSSICKRTDALPPTYPPEISGTCPDISSKDWIPFRGHCYYFEPSPSVAWSGASFNCLQYGAYLVSIEDAAESDFLIHHMELLSDQGNRYWIGLYRNVEDNWFWVDKTPMDFVNWNHKDNDNAHQSKCVMMNARKGTWDVKLCDEKYGYICKTSKILLPTEMPIKIPEEKPFHGVVIGVVFLVVLLLTGVTITAIFVYKRKGIKIEPVTGIINKIYFESNQSAEKCDVLVENMEQNENTIL